MKTGMFRSLGVFNYRLWAIGALVSNIGAWMQRTAQDWLVLTELTDFDAIALGWMSALQFGPQLLLLPITGLVADRFDKRTVLIVTQVTQGLLALGLGLMTLLGHVELWHVFVFAGLLGCTTAFDSPARQTFVGNLVPGDTLANAVALNSASFQTARLIGPAAAGFTTAALGAGWAFMLNAASFAAVVIALSMIRKSELRQMTRATAKPFDFVAGFVYIAKDRTLLVVFAMIFIYGTFGLNFSVFASTMTAVEFGLGATEYGFTSTVMAIGALVGSLLAARREWPSRRVILIGSGLFGISWAFAAVMPTYLLFLVVLPFVGLASQTFMTTANAWVQLSTSQEMRGRVMAVYMAVMMGTTPLGAPIVGWVVDEFGPRWGLGVAAAAGVIATLIGVIHVLATRRISFTRVPDSRWRLDMHAVPRRRLEHAEHTELVKSPGSVR